MTASRCQLALVLVVFLALLLSAAAHGVHRAQGRGAHPAALRAVPRRAEGLLQPFADVFKLFFKEELRPKAADTILFYWRRSSRRRRVRRVRGRAVRRRDDVLRPARPADPAVGRRRERRRARGLRDRVDGRLRHRARRLEHEQQVLAARRPALVGADDQLRAVVRPLARGRAGARQLAVAPEIVNAQAGTGSGSSRSGSSSCSRSGS